jgi:GT2 family glycosyltransferase
MTEYNSPSVQPSASIVVVSYNTSAHIGSCLLSLLELDYPRVEIIVVDNASTDGSVELVRSRFPDVEVVELPAHKGFAGAARVGLFMASGEIVAAVNPDVRLHPGWLAAVSATLHSRGDVGIVGSKILYPDRRTIQHAGGTVDYPLATTRHLGRGEPDTGQYDHPREVQFVTGAALAMGRNVGRALKFFDEDYFPMYYEDVDLCRRAHNEGLRVVYQPRAVAYHEESVTMDRQSSLYYSYFHVNRLRYVIKQYSPEQVMLDFLPAEAARISGDMAPEDREASLALLDNSTANGRPPVGATSQHKVDTLRTHVAEVMRGWRVRERPFTSSAPLLGSLVVALRRRLNNLSTRWYVQPILQQQVDYNASVARALREMSAQLAELQARVSIQSIMTAGLASQWSNASVDNLSSELEALRVRLDQLEREAVRTPHRHGAEYG